MLFGVFGLGTQLTRNSQVEELDGVAYLGDHDEGDGGACEYRLDGEQHNWLERIQRSAAVGLGFIDPVVLGVVGVSEPLLASGALGDLSAVHATERRDQASYSAGLLSYLSDGG